MHVLIEPEIFVAFEILWMDGLERSDFRSVHEHRVCIAVDECAELLEALRVVVLAHARVVPVVPTVDAADQVVPIDVAVGHERLAVLATAI